MLNLSHRELNVIAKIRALKDYKKMFEDKLLKALVESEQAKKLRKEIRNKKKKSDSDKIIRDIRTLYESEECYYEPTKINSVFNDNYIEYQSN